MKDIQTINAPETAKYLDEFMKEIPVNCLFDKGRTGCGGTTLALTNSKDTIIAMPYVSLIKNKLAQHNGDVLGVYGGVPDSEIIDYISSKKIWKIIVTYDSLGRLVSVLSENGIDVFDKFFLLVDEHHILFNCYVFRNKAVKRVLSLGKSFKEVTYMTATPVEEDFILEELKDIPIKKVLWSNTMEVTVKPIISNKPYKTVAAIIKDALEGKIFGNLHFFVNSVEFIAKVLNENKIPPEQVRVICSKNDNSGKGNKTNQKKLGANYFIAETTDPVKRINFYTSTCFEGCDIYDKDGKTIIVSDGNKSHTLLDISTLFIQICGRIRESRYNTNITHIYSETRYSGDVTLEEYIKSTNELLAESESLACEINSMSDKNRVTTIKLIEKNKEGLNGKYIFNVDSKLEIDRNLLKVDIMNFQISKHLYQCRIVLQDEYSKNNFKVTDTQRVIYTDVLAANHKAKISWKDLFLEYATIRDAQKGLIYFGNPEDRQSLIENEKPLIKEAYEKLGAERVKELKYSVTNIKRELLKHTDASMDYKIIQCLRDMGIHEASTIPAKQLKETLQDIYTSLGRKTKAKATDIREWFDAKKISSKINGKTTECYSLIRCKLIYR